MLWKRVENLGSAILPWLVGPAMVAALYLIFMVVPTERDQGIVQRIFYVHVPSAWTAFFGFFVVCGASLLFLWRGRADWDRIAKASAEVGMVFCTLVLLTGPMWARISRTLFPSPSRPRRQRTRSPTFISGASGFGENISLKEPSNTMPSGFFAASVRT